MYIYILKVKIKMHGNKIGLHSVVSFAGVSEIDGTVLVNVKVICEENGHSFNMGSQWGSKTPIWSNHKKAIVCIRYV